MFDINLAMFSSDAPIQHLSSAIEKESIIKDPLLLPHLSNIIAAINAQKTTGDIIHLSNVVKQTELKPKISHYVAQTIPYSKVSQDLSKANREYVINNFKIQSQKLKWAGFSLNKQQINAIAQQVTLVGERQNVKEIRFWGKINGTKQDYYILQGQTANVKPDLTEIVKGGQKNGQGINFYTFWATNNLLSPEWFELPLINPYHVKTARRIKKYFTGYLQDPIYSYPEFKGVEKHYLKAQLVRMTYSLQLSPKGIYKVHDENPKVIQYQEEPKVPQFSELSTLESWVHKNQNVLHLGRCTHFIDPALPEDQIQAATAELAEKDPEIQRLRSITEDKLPQGSPFGIQNIWQIKIAGDTQVFQKDEGVFVYAVAILKNLYWPGWVSIGYKNGFTNYYTGYGLKWTQNGWDQYENGNLSQQAQDVIEYHEPNPKQQPKPAVAVVSEQEPPQQ